MMKPNWANLNSLTASIVIEELIRQGVNFFCLSPGSRSAPLAVAAAENEAARVSVHFDERGAAFQGLGFAHATGRPAAIICTSGTAVANLFPAVIEAAQSRLPMILLTADRPEEVRQTGANQTIDQVNIFGNYVRWFYDLPCPSLNILPEELLSIIDLALAKATGDQPGPVHLNFQYREPLAPLDDEIDYIDYLKSITGWVADDQPFKDIREESESINQAGLSEIVDSVARAERGLVLIGGLDSHLGHEAVAQLANRTGWPVLADIRSSLSLGGHISNRLHHFDQLLLSTEFKKLLAADTILHLGGSFVSKRLLQFLDSYPAKNYIHIAPEGVKLDPGHRVTNRIEAKIDPFCAQLVTQLTEPASPSHMKGLIAMSDRAEKIIDQSVKTPEQLCEPLVARTISELISEDQALYLANSLSVREFDSFAVKRKFNLPVGCNRGASGIDGTLASACGFGAGLEQPVTLLIGDLAFLHDLNSLALVKNSTQPINIILLNNDGGNIFSILPIAQFEAHFEKLFITPHGLTFEKAAEMFSLEYDRVDCQEQLAEKYREHLISDRSTLLEVIIDRHQRPLLDKKLRTSIEEQLD